VTLFNAKTNHKYEIINIDLDVNIKRRLEALGLTDGTSVALLHKKRKGSSVIMVRGTRLAVGRMIAEGIKIKDPSLHSG